MRINNPLKLISQPKIFFYCFIAGFLIWFFNELNNRSNASMYYPINFKYDIKEEHIEVLSPPDAIQISINGTGWNLLRNILKINIQAIEYNINKPLQTKFILSNSLLPSVSQSLENVNLNYIVTDSIFLNIENKMGKELDVLIDSSSISIADGFERVSDFTLSHNKIYIEGPRSIINSLPNTYLLKSDNIINLTSNFDEDIIIEKIDKDVLVNPESINLSFKIEEFVQEEIIIKVNFQDGNFKIDTSVTVLYKMKKGDEPISDDSLFVNLIKKDGYLIPEVNSIQDVQILNISPNSFILDK